MATQTKNNHRPRAYAEDVSGLPVKRAIKVDTGRMSYKDLRLLLAWQGVDKDDDSPEAAAESAKLFQRVLDMLDRVVIGGIDDLPLDTLPEIVEAIGFAMQKMSVGKQAKN